MLPSGCEVGIASVTSSLSFPAKKVTSPGFAKFHGAHFPCVFKVKPAYQYVVMTNTRGGTKEFTCKRSGLKDKKLKLHFLKNERSFKMFEIQIIRVKKVNLQISYLTHEVLLWYAPMFLHCDKYVWQNKVWIQMALTSTPTIKSETISLSFLIFQIWIENYSSPQPWAKW